jgi:alkaline phosphatase D
MLKHTTRLIRVVVSVVSVVGLLVIGSLPLAAQSLTFHPVIGAVTEHSAVVYARVTPAAAVSVRYGRQAGGSDGVISNTVTTMANHDFIAHIRLEGLAANTRYYFTVRVNGTDASARRSFRTFPPPGDLNTEFRAVIFADANVPETVDNPQRTAPKYTTPYTRAVALDPDVWLQIGDFSHYNASLATPLGDIKHWWENNRRAYLTTMYRPSESAATSVPFVHIDDDHDRGGNNIDRTSWFIIHPSIQAFLDYFPTYDRPDTHALYQRFSFGRLVQVFVLDTRTYRDPRTVPAAQRTMLGATQKAWLLAAVQASSARWKLIVTTVPWNPTVPKTEAWAGYQTERAELMQTLVTIPGVQIISGDIHSGGGIDDGTHAGLPEINVSHTNMALHSSCTGTPCGTWSHGSTSLVGHKGGFFSIDATFNTLTLTNHDFYGVPTLRAQRTYGGGMISRRSAEHSHRCGPRCRARPLAGA